jgi:hypothetical protein
MEVFQQRLPIEVWAELVRSVSGSVVFSHSEHYDTARASWNGMLDRKPMERIVYGRHTEIIVNG